MIKLLFLSYRDFETVNGFKRELEPPKKYFGNPIMVSDHPAESNYMSFYGSVIRRPDTGAWQMWYTVFKPKGIISLAYAESEDGIKWRKPALDIVKVGREKTHLVLDNHPHGAAVIYDERDERPDWKYKLMAGAAPSSRIGAFHSGDGIHWLAAAPNPVIGNNPDCPIGFYRADDGRYVAYYRENFGDRRVARSESWDFRHWSEPRIVLEPNPHDPAQTQMYGMDVFPYGAYEIGLVWMYHTCENDMEFTKIHGRIDSELAFTRTGYAWHRAAEGRPWIALGRKGSWEWGMIEPASMPVFLDDEIRFYYSGCGIGHGEVGKKRASIPRFGIGFVSMKPDRFVRMTASSQEGLVLTRPFWTETPEFFINADVSRNEAILAEIADIDGRPIPGFAFKNAVPVTGDSTHHRLAWRNNPDASGLAHRQIRLRIKARNAGIYSLFSGSDKEIARYGEFRIPHFRPMEKEKNANGS